MENNLTNFIFILLFLFFGCSRQNEQNQTPLTDTLQISPNNTLIISQPEQGKVYKYSDSIVISSNNYFFSAVDSITIFINRLPFKNYSIHNGKLIIYSESLKAGSNQIQITIYKDAQIFSNTLSIVLISNKAPQEYTYKILNRYPHDDRSYTQGLEFYNGYMYEGSGQYGESMLRKYKLETGELIQSYNLPNDVFGEGIVVYKQKIYQLTWQSRIAYEFDLNTFKLLRTFEFNTEGWGITKYKDMLVMSDGSNRLYFLNPETFMEVDRLEVYNHIGPVTQLNELEYIDGFIYANVYLTDDIVIINPNTGFVEGIIRLNNLLDLSKALKKPDVLNGIAYDSSKKRLFVTGKYWPEIYQIEIIPKK
ncbi:MAG: glutaminyl-peptide cyclotransferase [Bacteroidales bacterium]|nr:glutaminyl-peptide cyclotransferase [Bacteroidales bacterium]